MKKHYVLGFMFDEVRLNVILIRKNHPGWQAGKLNGVGGKYNPQIEDPRSAMCREFMEEAGVTSDISEWVHAGTMSGIDWQVEVFTMSACDSAFNAAKTMETETIEKFLVTELLSSNEEMIDNLEYLIPMCREIIRSKAKFNIEYL